MQRRRSKESESSGQYISDYLYYSSDVLKYKTPLLSSEGLHGNISKFEGTSGSYYIRRSKTPILINKVTKKGPDNLLVQNLNTKIFLKDNNSQNLERYLRLRKDKLFENLCTEANPLC